MFMFDLETLGTESTSIVLSAAIIHFDFDTTETYEQLVSRACFVKFSGAEQRHKLKRLYSKDTLAWWKKQSEIARKHSLEPSEQDVSVAEGLEKIRAYIQENGGNKQIIWARGSLDQMAIDSLAVSIESQPIAMYNMWRDVRTAVDILAENSKGGYCDIPGFNPDLHVIKHVPQNDCALDILTLIAASKQ